MTVEECDLPADALLSRYRADGPNGDGLTYTDCFRVYVDRTVGLEQFVFAFYTGRVFRLERWLLKVFGGLPSTDKSARAVANGTGEAFAAWTVADRTDTELLMCDVAGRTRSWFKVAPTAAGEGGSTRLMFGSAVVPKTDPRTGRKTMGSGFRALLGFHRVYSRVLLSAARSRLSRGIG